jgi:cephalosporin-C deacetylase-like acetyl esterase
MAMAERKNIEFGVEGGVTLRGWLFVPGAKGPAPAITMAHGYAGVKEHGLERFARAFAEAGFVVLVHDHRHFGASDGAERGDVDPWQQIADWRRAISFLESRPEVDAAQIGIWGTSYAGGHAIVLGATDRRLRAVVAQVPTISGFEQGLRRVAPDGIAALERAFAEDDRGQGSDQIGVKISFKDRHQRRNSSSNPLCRYVSPAPPMYNENERHYVTHPVDEMASI